MGIKKYINIKFRIKKFFGLNDNYESLLNDQKMLLKKLQKLKNVEMQEYQSSYLDYLTLINLLYFIIFLSFLGNIFYLYNANIFNNSILESLKSLGSLSIDLQNINQKSILEALSKFLTNLSKEELKLLMEIKNLLLANFFSLIS